MGKKNVKLNAMIGALLGATLANLFGERLVGESYVFIVVIAGLLIGYFVGKEI